MVVNRAVEPVLASIPGNHVLPNQYYTTIKINKTTTQGANVNGSAETAIALLK